VSENVKEAAINLIGESYRDRIIVIPPVTMPLSEKKRGEYKKIPIQIAYVGRIEIQAKRVDRFVSICDELNKTGIDWRFHIIGSGLYLDTLKTELMQYILMGNAIVHGSKRHQEIDQILSSTHILLLTSDYEGCPHSVLEAMSGGIVPVVPNIEGSTSAIINDGLNGILTSQFNVTDIVNAILLLNENRNTLQDLSLNAMETYASKYNKKHISSLWRLIFSGPENNQNLIIYKRRPRITDYFVVGYLLRRLRAQLGSFKQKSRLSL